MQHKQIRPKDLHHERDSISSFSLGTGDTPGYRPHLSSSLPPSGTAAPQSMWYDDHDTVPKASTSDNESSGDVQAGVPDESADLTSTSTAGEGPRPYVPTTEATSPLANLGSLQNALPDVSGNSKSAQQE